MNQIMKIVISDTNGFKYELNMDNNQTDSYSLPICQY